MGVLCTLFLSGAGGLIWLGQPVGAVLLPALGVLIVALFRRDRRARTLARRIADGRLDEKVEVRPGAWGDLDRAVNGLLQGQRLQKRLRAILPTPLPENAVQSLLNGRLPAAGEPRMVAVLLASCALPRSGEREQQSSLDAWSTLAQTSQELAERHNALLQPCGDAVMLVFGAFEEQIVGESLRAALSAGEALRHEMRVAGVGPSLVISLAIGAALATPLPGLGFCVLGAPVGEAKQIQQLALQSRHGGVLCGEGVYHALRQSPSPIWRPTELRLVSAHRGPQTVYMRVEPSRMQ
jgi:class 3 adenylate cyclase